MSKVSLEVSGATFRAPIKSKRIFKTPFWRQPSPGVLFYFISFFRTRAKSLTPLHECEMLNLFAQTTVGYSLFVCGELMQTRVCVCVCAIRSGDAVGRGLACDDDVSPRVRSTVSVRSVPPSYGRHRWCHLSTADRRHSAVRVVVIRSVWS